MFLPLVVVVISYSPHENAVDPRLVLSSLHPDLMGKAGVIPSEAAHMFKKGMQLN